MEAKIYDLEDRLIEFAIKASNLIEMLPNANLANHRGNQAIRSCTSPALLYGEAQSGESHKDFIHKIQILLKELGETKVCLRLFRRKRLLKDETINPVLQEKKN